MPEPASTNHHHEWAHLHAALEAAYAEVLSSPDGLVEGLDGALCGPHVKHLSTLAAVSAADGMSEDQWRATVLANGGARAAVALDMAVACMRQSGLWPWNAAGQTVGTDGGTGRA